MGKATVTATVMVMEMEKELNNKGTLKSSAFFKLEIILGE